MTLGNPGTVTFSLGAAGSISGVDSWALNFSRALERRGTSTEVLHHSVYDQKLNASLRRYTEPSDSVFLPNYSYFAYSALSRRTRSGPSNSYVIAFCHSDDPFYYRLLSHYEPIIDRFVAVSTECSDRLRDCLPERSEDVSTKPYFVDREEALARAYSNQDQPIRILYAGRITQQQKRIFDLVKVAETLSSLDVNFELSIAGSGKDEAELRHKISLLDSRVAERIRLLGQLSPQQVRDTLQQSDVAILVSDFEGTSVFMLEAMACGCVPVVTQVSGATEVIQHGINGLLFPTGDLDSISHGIQSLAENRDELVAMGRRAHQNMQAHDVEEYCDWFQDLVAEVRSHGGRRKWPIARPSMPLDRKLLYSGIRAGQRFPLLTSIYHGCRQLGRPSTAGN